MSTNLSSADPKDWITQAEAARVRGISRQAIARLIQRGRLATLQVGGVTFVKRVEVEAFEPAAPGRKAAT